MNALTQSIITHGFEVASEIGASIILVSPDPMVDIEGFGAAVTPHGDKTVVLTSNAKRFASLDNNVRAVLPIPDIQLTRTSQIKLATLVALSRGILGPGQTMVCLTGAGPDLDTIVVVRLGKEYELFLKGEDAPFAGSVRPEVFEQVIGIATELAREGKNDRPAGALFVVGDEEAVGQYCRQLIFNPFQGYPESERNILDPALKPTVFEFSTIDGAFIVRGDGVIVSAGTYLNPTSLSVRVPKGLGARHQAGAAITAVTDSVAVVVSETLGSVSIFKNGNVLMELERPRSAEKELSKKA